MTVTVPAVCEDALKNQPEASRLAVIIDQLVQANGGVNPNGSFGIGGVPFTSADASAVVVITDAPTVGLKLVVDSLYISSAAALNLTFKEETSGTVILGPIYMAANSTVQLTNISKKLPTINKKLAVQASGVGNITISTKYHSEA